MTESNQIAPDGKFHSMDWGLLILRFGVAAMLVTHHGWEKFAGAVGFLFGGKEWGFIGFIGSLGFPLPTFFALCAAFAEFIGCLLLMVGLCTRYAAAFVALTMSVAVYFHLTTDSGFELAAIYLLVTLFFVLSGAGRFSLDEWLRHRLRPQPVAESLQTAV
ncbi:MAG: DoxX family protein [Acidobacteriota bacterium]